jgi:hypothetical protein
MSEFAVDSYIRLAFIYFREMLDLQLHEGQLWVTLSNSYSISRESPVSAVSLNY